MTRTPSCNTCKQGADTCGGAGTGLLCTVIQPTSQAEFERMVMNTHDWSPEPRPPRNARQCLRCGAFEDWKHPGFKRQACQEG